MALSLASCFALFSLFLHFLEELKLERSQPSHTKSMTLRKKEGASVSIDLVHYGIWALNLVVYNCCAVSYYARAQLHPPPFRRVTFLRMLSFNELVLQEYGTYQAPALSCERMLLTLRYTFNVYVAYYSYY